jgi:hypothetical protein
MVIGFGSIRIFTAKPPPARTQIESSTISTAEIGFFPFLPWKYEVINTIGVPVIHKTRNTLLILSAEEIS